MQSLSLRTIANDAFRITEAGTQRTMGFGGPVVSNTTSITPDNSFIPGGMG